MRLALAHGNTHMAVAADKIDEAMAEEARQLAEARLREKLSDYFAERTPQEGEAA